MHAVAAAVGCGRSWHHHSGPELASMLCCSRQAKAEVAATIWLASGLLLILQCLKMLRLLWDVGARVWQEH